MTASIVLYESQLCGFCHAAKRLLDKKGWEYTTIPVDGNPEVMAEMQERTGRRTVPQIYFDDTHVGGFDDLAELDAEGKLESLYAGNAAE